MEPQLHWMYGEFFQTVREYVLYLQQLGLVLITAISVVFYNNIKSKKCFFWVVISADFILGIINLILGLFLYGNIFNLILDTSLKTPDLTTPRYLIYTQFVLEMIIVLFLVLASLSVRKKD